MRTLKNQIAILTDQNKAQAKEIERLREALDGLLFAIHYQDNGQDEHPMEAMEAKARKALEAGNGD